MTREERHLTWFVAATALSFAVEAALYVPEVFRNVAATRPYAINSTAKDVLFFALTAVAAADIRRWSRLIGFVILGHVVILMLLVLAIATGNGDFVFPPPRWLADLAPFLDPTASARAWIWLGLCLAATGSLIWLYHRALRARYQLRYLWPIEHDTLAAVADAILDEPRMKPADIATKIDRYWASLDIGYKTRLRAALWLVLLLPMRWLRPPLTFLERDTRRDLIENKMLRAIAGRSGLGPLRTAAQSSVRFAMQLVYIGYYDDPSSYEDTGYTRFSERPANGRDRTPRRPSKPLRVLARPERETPLRADIVIAGSGAGGSIAAHVLAEAGRDVLMVERGAHVDPDTFSEDEADQYARLYSDGALQVSRDFSFQVLQGMCVGGGTVVNNAICLDPPDEVLERWNGPQFDAGLPLAEVKRSVAQVRALIRATPQSTAPPNGIVHRVPVPPLQPLDANIEDCLGSGYCNIGCKWGRKLSMLDTVLPDTQRSTDERRERQVGFKGRLEILPDCEVTEVRTRDGRATGLRCQLRLPGGKRRALEIDADTVILAAGAIHSSRVLMQSGIGGDRVGRELCANIGSHMTGWWSDGQPVRAYEGLQMSHVLDDGVGGPDYMVEAWFNPVMSQALVMPGWVGDHERNMRRYDQLGVLGVISGSTPNGNRVLRRREFLSGAEIDFTPSELDLRRLLSGLRHAGGVLLDHGAECVIPATFAYHEFGSKAELEELELGRLVTDASDISVNTAHPQGGNAISRDPRKGVIGSDFRIHGLENLYVMDASVFPTSVGVNPQLSVMALTHYAASRIA